MRVFAPQYNNNNGKGTENNRFFSSAAVVIVVVDVKSAVFSLFRWRLHWYWYKTHTYHTFFVARESLYPATNTLNWFESGIWNLVHLILFHFCFSEESFLFFSLKLALTVRYLLFGHLSYFADAYENVTYDGHYVSDVLFNGCKKKQSKERERER